MKRHHSREGAYLKHVCTKQREAVERAFLRLKGQRALNHITVWRRRNVTVHCYLSLIAMQASPSALGAT